MTPPAVFVLFLPLVPLFLAVAYEEGRRNAAHASLVASYGVGR